MSTPDELLPLLKAKFRRLNYLLHMQKDAAKALDEAKKAHRIIAEEIEDIQTALKNEFYQVIDPIDE